MKTIKELAPTWAQKVKEEEMLPITIGGAVEVNGDVANMGNPNSCFVGEARGGNCYYDKHFITRKISFWTKRLKEVKKPNPKYCEECHKASMEFFDLSDAYGNGGWDKKEYEELCRKYEEHYDEAHNGDKC